MCRKQFCYIFYFLVILPLGISTATYENKMLVFPPAEMQFISQVEMEYRAIPNDWWILQGFTDDKTWRSSKAAYALVQLAVKLKVPVEKLTPNQIAAAIGVMEGGNVFMGAESARDRIEKDGLANAMSFFDTIVMVDRHVTGNLSESQTNMTIYELSLQRYETVLRHLEDISMGKGKRLLPDGYINFFAPRALDSMPVSEGHWNKITTKSGQEMWVPYWAVEQMKQEEYVYASGVYYIKPVEARNFKAIWSK